MRHELISDVLAFSPDALWAVDINHGGAALLIGLLLGHQQPMVYLTGLAVHRASAGYRGQAKTDARDASSSPTKPGCATTWAHFDPAMR